MQKKPGGRQPDAGGGADRERAQPLEWVQLRREGTPGLDPEKIRTK